MNGSNLVLLGLSQQERMGDGEQIVGPSRISQLPGNRTAGDPAKWSVPPLAEMTALNETAELREARPEVSHESLCLSRFAYLRPLGDALVLESPLSQFRITLTDSRAGGLLLELIEPRSPQWLDKIVGLPAKLVHAFVQLLWSGGFLTADAEPAELRIWDFHNLVFHGRKRWHGSATARAENRQKAPGSFPVVKFPVSAKGQPLPIPNLNDAAGSDQTLVGVMEARRSIREFDDEHPITLKQLGELLYRAARVKDVYKSRDKFGAVANAEQADQDTMLSERPYPGAGARYELELYPVIRHCEGLDGGLYHYDPLHHRLEQIRDGQDDDVMALIEDAFASTGRQGKPQVLLIVAARFGRMFEAYPHLGYSLILKNVGILYQNLYLVATAMKLAPCALGEGEVDRFGRAAGLEFCTETMVGGFLLGTPAREARSPAGADKPHEIVPANDEPAPVVVPGPRTSSSAAPANGVKPATAPQPHDLDDRLPGLSGLREMTSGDSAVTIVVLDGDPDLALSCFRAGHVSKKYPFWHPRAEPIAAEQHALYRRISESDLEPDDLELRLTDSFPPRVLNRIIGNRHATHVTSIIAGRPNSPVPGIAPECRVIVVPLNEMGEPGEFMSALNLARGFELAQELGANIIHCAACVPTQTDEPQELLAQAVKKCLDDNILIVAPVGNDNGDCRCIPAVLPGTLAVGALKDDGRPFDFSNWGGNYSIEGIVGPGERILCAQPCIEQPIREKGTSLAAPVITGIVALLMSRQLQVGRRIDAESIRAALLATARPCDPAIVENPERCLRGVIDLPAVIDALFGPSGGITASSNIVRLFGRDPVVRGSQLKIPASDDAASRTDREVPSVTPSALDGATKDTPDSAMSEASSLAMSETAAVSPSTAHSGLVFALGQLSYDLGTELGRQTLEQRMARGVELGELTGANPNDVRDLIEYLDRHPTERRCVIWTLEIDGAPVYALEPRGPYADEIYEILLQLLNGQIQPQDAVEFVERVSIPGVRSGRMVELLSREKLPVVTLADVRGLYGWQVNALVRDAVASAVAEGSLDYQILYDALADFLKRVYFGLRNYGLTSRDRAMNFAATNCFQAASVFARALAEGRVLETIAVEKSPVCRMNSDCWELYLTFHDPEHAKRATRVFHFTLDVSDILPVTVGAPKSWTRRPH